MKKYKVVYTTDATYDLLSISAGITAEYGDPVGAMRTADRLIAKCSSLVIFPEVSPVKMNVMGKKFRFIHSGKFIIIYTLDKTKSKVVIYRIVGSSRDIDKLMLDA